MRLLKHAAAALMAVAPITMAAAQTMEMKLADTMPAGHTIHRAVTDMFMKDVEQATQGRVTLRHYPGGQLGKGPDSLRLIQAGLQDIGLISPSHISDKMPLTAVGELPGNWTRACEAAVAMWSMSQPGQILHEKEYGPNGIRVLVFFPLPGYQIMVSSNRPFNSLKDAEGLKMRTTGGALERIVRSMKGSAVRMTAPEMYEAMARGTIDGALFSYQAATSYELTKMIKVSTEGQNLGTVVNAYFISENKWKSLPEAVRTQLHAAGEKATKEGCKGLDAAEDVSKETMRAAGTRFFSLNAEDQVLVDKNNAEVQQEWAADLDRRGRPGSDVLKAFRAALRSTS